MTASEWIGNVARDATSFARDAIKHPVAAAFVLGLFSFGLYVMALIAWLFVLLAASWVGFYPEDQIREDRERAIFISAHRRAFCARERLPGAYCDEIFVKSPAFDEAIRLWVREKIAEDKRKQDAAPYWGLLEPFKLPTSRR